MSDPLTAQWCCLACFAKFPMGKLKIHGGQGERPAGNELGLNCPSCRSVNVYPADGTAHVLGEAPHAP